MRPRVFPAEDTPSAEAFAAAPRSFNEAAGIPRGRRPCVLDGLDTLLVASMRPRVFPAEDVGLPRHRYWRVAASMRPRVFPAEDDPQYTGRRSAAPRFNEAAGIPRGRPVTSPASSTGRSALQ